MHSNPVCRHLNTRICSTYRKMSRVIYLIKLGIERPHTFIKETPRGTARVASSSFSKCLMMKWSGRMRVLVNSHVRDITLPTKITIPSSMANDVSTMLQGNSEVYNEIVTRCAEDAYTSKPLYQRCGVYPFFEWTNRNEGLPFNFYDSATSHERSHRPHIDTISTSTTDNSTNVELKPPCPPVPDRFPEMRVNCNENDSGINRNRRAKAPEKIPGYITPTAPAMLTKDSYADYMNEENIDNAKRNTYLSTHWFCFNDLIIYNLHINSVSS